MTINIPPQQILTPVRAVCGENIVSLHETSVSRLELQIVADCIDTTFVSSVGE